jgi:hypothetical protein
MSEVHFFILEMNLIAKQVTISPFQKIWAYFTLKFVTLRSTVSAYRIMPCKTILFFKYSIYDYCISTVLISTEQNNLFELNIISRCEYLTPLYENILRECLIPSLLSTFSIMHLIRKPGFWLNSVTFNP